MERYLYKRLGSPVKIVRVVETSDRGIEIETENFRGFAADNKTQVYDLVTRFYPWTSVDYIETRG